MRKSEERPVRAGTLRHRLAERGKSLRSLTEKLELRPRLALIELPPWGVRTWK
jgi:hypothetical protein